MTAHLDPAYELVYDVLTEDRTTVEVVAVLRSRGYLVSHDGLDEAVRALDRRDRFAGRSGDPYEYLELAGPRQPTPSVWEAAQAKAETELEWALHEMTSNRLAVAL